ncbi:hypothetical protein Tco_1468229 [Tanacetum coccineum]
MRDVTSSLYHSLHPSGTPPLLPIPLPAPSTSRRADIPEADTNRLGRDYYLLLLDLGVHRHKWQRQAADDLAVQHIMRTQALEAGARVDTLEDTGSSS